MAPESAPLGIKVCGVAVVGGDEFPCVLEDQHEGFCDFGAEYEARNAT